MEAALKRKDELIEKRPQVNLSIDKFWLLSINMKIHSRINRRYNKTDPGKTLWSGLCICVKNICSIQFPIMEEQTDVSVNAFEKILSRVIGQYGLSLLGRQGVCIYKRSKPAVPGDAGNRGFACWEASETL